MEASHVADLLGGKNSASSSYGLDKEQGSAYCPSRVLKSGMTVAELLDDNLMISR
jgi:hypothetical protein